MPTSVVCDRDPKFISLFWREHFQLNETKFNFIVNRTLEMLPWVEFCYKTSVHSTTKKSHFEVFHVRLPPTLLCYVPGTTKVAVVEDILLERDTLLREVQQ